jgi:hypothetical protein
MGYVYGVVGRPKKQATLLAAAIAGSNGSAMGFLVGRDLQMPGVDRLFMDPVASVGYLRDAEAFIVGTATNFQRLSCGSVCSTVHFVRSRCFRGK